MSYITSTMTTSVEYALYKRTPGGETSIAESVIIEGGANVASKHFVTTDGVVTKVTDDQIALLEKCAVFQLHQSNGFVKIHKTSKKAVKDMAPKDKSAPLTPKTYAKKKKKAPTTSKED